MMKLIITERITVLVEKSGILLDEQGGFRTGRETHDKTNILIHMLDEAKTRDKKIYVLFVDIKKCYDNINHSILIQTLEMMGFLS